MATARGKPRGKSLVESSFSVHPEILLGLGRGFGGQVLRPESEQLQADDVSRISAGRFSPAMRSAEIDVRGSVSFVLSSTLPSLIEVMLTSGPGRHNSPGCPPGRHIH